ncbi:MAG TPA: glycoside hydrolase family 27 protein [Saprospiraceae bacterium]|nr:glycoside hydrolase family 27 protein [Saprospiraceae bacterium]
MKIFSILMILFCSTIIAAQKFDGLAPTPPMGWNSWNTFQTNINEQLVKDIADRFISLGLKEAGYQYIVLDDGWMSHERDKDGNLVADPEKFPNGMKHLADYIHAKGLKFGLYNCAGWKTCGGYPGSRGHEFQDAMKYAEWDVDYLKYDWCNTDKLNAEGAYLTMRDALHAAGRPIVFSMCEWGDNQPWKWGKDIGHLWRTTGDISACWDCEDNHGTWSSWGVLRVLHMREAIRQYAGPDHWNDPDMMEVGNGMTTSEDRGHFSLWCMVAAPLIMGNDLRNATFNTLNTLTNKEAIAIDQDALGIQGYMHSQKDSIEVFVKPLADGDWAFCFLNRNEMPRTIHFDWDKENVEDAFSGRKLITSKKEIYTIRDIWKKKEMGMTHETFNVEVKEHDVCMVRLALKSN